MIFNKLGLDTEEVLNAAGTKWNFLPFKPGLVGGHCIGVDPYYLTHKALALGYEPEMILAGRRINDNMGNFIGRKAVEYLKKMNVQMNVLIFQPKPWIRYMDLYHLKYQFLCILYVFLY